MRRFSFRSLGDDGQVSEGSSPVSRWESPIFYPVEYVDYYKCIMSLYNYLGYVDTEAVFLKLIISQRVTSFDVCPDEFALCVVYLVRILISGCASKAVFVAFEEEKRADVDVVVVQRQVVIGEGLCCADV